MKLFKKRKSKLSRRITWRVILTMVFFNVFIFGAVVISDLAFSLVEGENRAQHMMEGVRGKLATTLKTVEISAENNIAEVEANLTSPEKVYDALEHELLLNRHYLGCRVAFEPNFFHSQGHWFEPYVRFDDSTHVERIQLGSAQHDYFKLEWYKKGLELEKGKGHISDPYLDNDGGKSILCTYASPIYDGKGRKVGVYGIDLNLSWLEKTISYEEEKVKMMESVENDPNDSIEENAFFIQVLDSKGRKIAGSETFDDNSLQTILKQDSIAFESVKIKGITYYVSSRRLASTGWTLLVAQHKSFVFLNGYARSIVVLFFMIVGAIVTFFLTSRGINRSMKPLRFLSESAKEVAQGNFDTPLPTFKHQDEIAQLSDSFDTMQQSLKNYMEELKASTTAKASMESELNVAHNIQLSMLPKTHPPFPDRNDIDIYGIQKAAKAVGGDLYDFFIRDEKLFFCIGDVSGKGVPASLVMAVTRTLFRNVAAHTAEPNHIVYAMNESICEGNDNNMFVTIFVGVLDLHSGRLSYCNAGHDAPFYQNKLLPCNSNIPIGVMQEWNFTEQVIKMAPGTTIFLYTDGLTEAENAQLEQFGIQRVANLVTLEKSPQKLIEQMVDAVRQFVGNTEQNDDITMLAIKYTNNEPITDL